MLQGQDLEFFLSKYFTRLPFSIPNGALEFKHHLNWEIVESVIETQKSILRIIKDGVMTKDHAQIDFKSAKQFFEIGNTLLLKNAELSHLTLKELANDFSNSFHTEVDIQLYCTPENHNAFGWHYDVEEVFIIQTKGSKLYTIRHNTVHPNPLISSISSDFGYEKETSDLQMTVFLNEGDWLYIPSGWWHIARTQSESMHISIGLMPRSAIDVVSFLPTYLSQDSFWRKRMPVHKEFNSETEKLAFYKDAMEALGKDLQKKISDPEFIKQLLNDLTL